MSSCGLARSTSETREEVFEPLLHSEHSSLTLVLVPGQIPACRVMGQASRFQLGAQVLLSQHRPTPLLQFPTFRLMALIQRTGLKLPSASLL